MDNAYSARNLDIRAKKSHPLEWLFEPLEDQPGYMRRKFFSGEAAYLNGRLSLIIIAKEEPWNGLLVITGRESHSALQAQWKQLKPHEVLGKWLYLSQGNPAFETVATSIVQSILRGDERIGIEPKLKKKRKKGKTTKAAKKKK